MKTPPFTPKRPNWNLCVRHPVGRWEKVGAGWTSEHGNISIKLESGQQWKDLQGLPVLLFPVPCDEDDRPPVIKPSKARPLRQKSPDYMEQRRQERKAPTPTPTIEPMPSSSCNPQEPQDAPEGPEWLS